MKISIITINYNSKNDLIKTFLSVKNQKFNDYEHLIIDGGSNDGSIEWLSKNMHDKIKFFSEVDDGIYYAMNKGVKIATGDWLFFLNSGDIFYDDFVLERISKDFDNSFQFISGGVLYRFVSKDVLTFTSPKINFYSISIAHQQGVFIARDVFTTLKFDITYKLRAESDFFLRAFLDGMHFKMTTSVISIYDPYGISSRVSLQQFIEGWRLGFLRVSLYWLGFPIFYLTTQLPKIIIRKIFPI